MTQSPSRRRFLQQLGQGAGTAAALTAFPPAIQRALAIPANRRTGTLKDVEHIVVLMQENRSFDHYFGTMNGVRGFADPFPIPVADRRGRQRRTVWFQPNEAADDPRVVTPFRLDTGRQFEVMRVEGTPHAWADSQFAWNLGKLDAWTLAKLNHSMGYYAERDLPFQWALADAFTLCDAYHCSSQTGTNTNRLFLWTGTNDPLARGNGPATYNDYDWFTSDPGQHGGYDWTTYPERLEAAGVSWQVYENMEDNFTDNPLAGFKSFRAAWFQTPGYSESLRQRGVSTRDLDLLKADVLADRLPQISWIVGTAAGSEHPGPSSPAQGADYTARVLDALTANPEVWARTVLFVNFDENDGFFDHVPPPAAPAYLRWDQDPSQASLAGASTVDTTGEYHEVIVPYHDDATERALLHRPYGLGPRVPMYVISPWSKGGWVCSQVFDHTSVVRFMEKRFGVEEPNISAWRRAVCGDLTSAFNFLDPDDRGFMRRLPSTVELAERAAALPGRTTPQTPDDPRLPRQEAGVRPSRALPYELHASSRVRVERGAAARDHVDITFTNSGQAAAVFHVYDRLQLDFLPRRYTVEPRKALAGRWAAQPDGDYDLWVLGPNGWHRHFEGNTRQVGGRGEPLPDVRLAYDREGGDLLITFVNRGDAPCRFLLEANRYFGHRADDEQRVVARSETTIARPIHSSGMWYDFSVRVEGLRFGRRFAGRMETGWPSVSDPAMSGRAIGSQGRD